MKAEFFDSVTWLHGANYSRFVYFSKSPPAKIKLTRTMLEKHIIDANETVRAFAKLHGVDYDQLKPGERVQVPAEFTDGSQTVVTFYRANKRGDRRISIKGLKGRASELDTVYITQRKSSDGKAVIVLPFSHPEAFAEIGALLDKGD